MRAWVNGLPITGKGRPLARGAFLTPPRSPADGAYALLQRTSEGVTNVVAEGNSGLGVARIQFLVFAGTQQASESAAGALRDQIERLTGVPTPCGNTGTRILVSDNWLGPFAIPVAPDAGEIWAYQVNADFMLSTA